MIEDTEGRGKENFCSRAIEQIDHLVAVVTHLYVR